jgi:hypothetical protein
MMHKIGEQKQIRNTKDAGKIIDRGKMGGEHHEERKHQVW